VNRRALLWRLRIAARAAGLPGGAALAVLGATALAWWTASVPAQRELARLEQALQQRPVPGVAAAAPADVAPDPVGEELRRFQALLVAPDATQPVLAGITAAARRHGVTLGPASFRLEPPGTGDIGRYTLDWPVRGDYPGVRRFVAEVLRQHPSLALDTLELRRPDATERAVEARLRWTLYLATTP
jgi:hypothetical protein